MGCRRTVFGAGMLILLLSAFMFGSNFVRAVRAIDLMLRGSVANGTIVDLKIVGADLTDSAVYPIVEFKSSDGRNQRFKSEMAGHGVPTVVGETVRVRYDPSAPERAAIDSFGTLAGPGLIFMFISIFPLGTLGAVMFFFTRFGASSDDAKITERPRWIPRLFPP